MFVSITWAKPKFKILHSVSGGLSSGLTFDANGNLYGATGADGTYNGGTIFKLAHKANGKWTEILLHNFNPDTDGAFPNGDLIFDAAGNLYGTTYEGGIYHVGTVFQMMPGAGGWTFSVIYNFCSEDGCPGGGGTSAGMTLDKQDDLYGTVAGGGAHGRGGVFELSPGSSGWEEQVPYSFGTRTYDGNLPYDAPTLGRAGSLYGTTALGGAYELGNVFRLSRASGFWTETILYEFCSGGFPCKDGAGPTNEVIFDSTGSLYGTTPGGGKNSCGEANCGTVFKLTPTRRGPWNETVLHNFRSGKGGFLPTSGLVFDKAGNLYGTTATGGIGRCFDGCGVVYELSHRGNGNWNYSVLHRFDGADGEGSGGRLILDKKGNLYGTAYSVVFEITP
jgi:uncharacterized repeat protein (TIGR03803 family)